MFTTGYYDGICFRPLHLLGHS